MHKRIVRLQSQLDVGGLSSEEEANVEARLAEAQAWVLARKSVGPTEEEVATRVLQQKAKKKTWLEARQASIAQRLAALD